MSCQIRKIGCVNYARFPNPVTYTASKLYILKFKTMIVSSFSIFTLRTTVDLLEYCRVQALILQTIIVCTRNGSDHTRWYKYCERVAFWSSICSCSCLSIIIYTYTWSPCTNPSKCDSLCISYKHSPPSAQYRLGGHQLSTKSTIRYLGIYINSHLKWNDHVKCITAKSSRTLNHLRHTLYTCPSSVKAVVCRCVVRPLLEYASPVWYLYSPGDIKKLEAVQRRAARWVVAVVGMLHGNVGLEHLTLVSTS